MLLRPEPLRHAPYADGPPDFAIGLKPIAPEAWLEGGEPDPAARKDPLFAAARPLVWGEAEGSRPGQQEVLELISAVTPVEPRPDLPPLYAAARAVADDLCLMEKRGEAWTLTAVSLSAGSFFTAAEALGRRLDQLHAPVPGFEDRFGPRVQRMFDNLPEPAILERRNWTVVNSGALHAPDIAAIRAEIPAIAPHEAADRLHLRIERQTLRRLPRTGGVLFTIRIWTHPLAALRDSPDHLAAFARAWRAAPEAFRAYKQLALYDALVEAFLRAEGE
ncbi:MAG: hypothetical protein BGN86_15640 [Caulobacterales bacterium 68-7]|nr:MAG: hypothetical protein BGN86_15640 [Caulobacterales bacterium 68-7]